jgi:hypothetical protein
LLSAADTLMPARRMRSNFEPIIQSVRGLINLTTFKNTGREL